MPDTADTRSLFERMSEMAVRSRISGKLQHNEADPHEETIAKRILAIREEMKLLLPDVEFPIISNSYDNRAHICIVVSKSVWSAIAKVKKTL